MTKTRPPYPAAFREQLVELARAGRSPAELSREFGPTAQSIANWMVQAARDAGRPLPGKEGLSSAERDELVRLRRQLKQVQLERDILAKATACFAGKSENALTSTIDSRSRNRMRRSRTAQDSVSSINARPIAD